MNYKRIISCNDLYVCVEFIAGAYKGKRCAHQVPSVDSPMGRLSSKH